MIALDEIPSEQAKKPFEEDLTQKVVELSLDKTFINTRT